MDATEIEMFSVTLKASYEERCHVLENTLDKWIYKCEWLDFIYDVKACSIYKIVLYLVERGDRGNEPVFVSIEDHWYILRVGNKVEVQFECTDVMTSKVELPFTFKYCRSPFENDKPKVGSIVYDLQRISKTSSDTITLVAKDGTEMSIGKLLFMARSKAFQTMFEHETDQKKENKVHFNEMTADALAKFVMFLTTDTVDHMDDSIAHQLGRMSHLNDIPLLFELVEDYFANNCNENNLRFVLELSFLRKSKKLALAYEKNVKPASSNSYTSLHKPRSLQDDMLALANTSHEIALVASDGSQFPINKFVFMARSKLLKAMLSDDAEEKSLNFKNVAANVLEKLVMFMTTDKVDQMDATTAHQLGLLAHQYDLPLLFQLVEDYFCKNCNKFNVDIVIELAYLQKSPKLVSAFAHCTG